MGIKAICRCLDFYMRYPFASMVRRCEKIPQEKLEQGSRCGIVLTGKFETGG
jgi:hypothetical protein